MGTKARSEGGIDSFVSSGGQMIMISNEIWVRIVELSSELGLSPQEFISMSLMHGVKDPQGVYRSIRYDPDG